MSKSDNDVQEIEGANPSKEVEIYDIYSDDSSDDTPAVPDTRALPTTKKP